MNRWSSIIGLGRTGLSLSSYILSEKEVALAPTICSVADGVQGPLLLAAAESTRNSGRRRADSGLDARVERIGVESGERTQGSYDIVP